LIVYFDTSAFIPLVIDEPGTEACRDLWYRTDKVASTRLLFVEASAAMASANRAGKMNRRALAAGLDAIAEYWRNVGVSELDPDLMFGAATMAHRFGLRGSDAIHCAAALQIKDDEVVAASGDRRLLEAWSQLGLNTFDANG
jgi:uncharacterized protein